MCDSHIPFSALACDRQRFWKRFTMSEAIAFTWGAHRARLQNCSAHSKGSANDGPMAWSQGRAHIPKAQPMTGQWRAGVGRAVPASRPPPCGSPGGLAPPPRPAHHPAAPPEGPPHPHPRPCCQWESNCLAIGPAREQFCRRAPCAPQGRAMAKH